MSSPDAAEAAQPPVATSAAQPPAASPSAQPQPGSASFTADELIPSSSSPADVTSPGSMNHAARSSAQLAISHRLSGRLMQLSCAAADSRRAQMQLQWFRCSNSRPNLFRFNDYSSLLLPFFPTLTREEVSSWKIDEAIARLGAVAEAREEALRQFHLREAEEPAIRQLEEVTHMPIVLVNIVAQFLSSDFLALPAISIHAAAKR